ncbi:hypothetical protein CMUS01_15992 [Colletotrichum musicola]|uniref:Uncharacterized protein n=1 Tax=Colletotrichum musicola TaxID=2175873 RepID=A0A8H6MKX8_9PEZI|nr:hypothetical protein CMUS01_15992 [Colletotrichum musicola]
MQEKAKSPRPCRIEGLVSGLSGPSVFDIHLLVTTRLEAAQHLAGPSRAEATELPPLRTAGSNDTHNSEESDIVVDNSRERNGDGSSFEAINDNITADARIRRQHSRMLGRPHPTCIHR